MKENEKERNNNNNNNNNTTLPYRWVNGTCSANIITIFICQHRLIDSELLQEVKITISSMHVPEEGRKEGQWWWWWWWCFFLSLSPPSPHFSSPFKPFPPSSPQTLLPPIHYFFSHTLLPLTLLPPIHSFFSHTPFLPLTHSSFPIHTHPPPLPYLAMRVSTPCSSRWSVWS